MCVCVCARVCATLFALETYDEAAARDGRSYAACSAGGGQMPPTTTYAFRSVLGFLSFFSTLTTRSPAPNLRLSAVLASDILQPVVLTMARAVQW